MLGIIAGSATVALGGPQGIELGVDPGDVLVLPAGTGHCNLRSSADLVVVGAYPDGMSWGIRRGDPHELAEMLANIRGVPLPGLAPSAGATAP